MAKLGYMWYPKDWGSSESVFELNLSERGLYREIIDLAMISDNKIKINVDVWIRKFCVSFEELDVILGKLSSLNLIEVKGDILFVPSCESRLNLARGGSKGGKKSKPTHKPIPKPDPEPTPNQIEIESKYKVNENENKTNKFNAVAFMCDLGFDQKLVSEWFEIRKLKKLKNTETALQGFYEQILKTNKPINDILKICVQKSWGGFNAEWAIESPTQTTRVVSKNKAL